ncbi:MAG: lysylphosphatidylglycerol synthase transmembrane domain-containing protein [Phycisphaerae bacterium]
MPAGPLEALLPTTFLLAWRLRRPARHAGPPRSRLGGRHAAHLRRELFNFALPGTTGGDLFKAYHIARIGHKRTEGVTIVFLDRVIGLVSFVLLAGAAIALSVVTGGVVIGRFGRLVGLMLAALVVAAMIFFSRRFRRWIGYEALLQRLPFADKLRRVDQTAFSFRYHPGRTAAALVVTAINHAFMALGVLYLARALGMPTDGRALTARTYLSFYLASLLSVTVGYLLAAVPVSFQGFGLLEAVFLRVLARGGWGTQSQVVALCLGTRVMQLLWALPGMIVPWLGLRRPGAAYETDVAAAEPATSPEARRADSV